MNDNRKDEIVLRAPIFVPLSVVVMAGSVLIGLVMGYAFIKFQLEAQAAEIESLKNTRQTGNIELAELKGDVRVIKAILTIKFPSAAKAASP